MKKLIILSHKKRKRKKKHSIEMVTAEGVGLGWGELEEEFKQLIAGKKKVKI